MKLGGKLSLVNALKLPILFKLGLSSALIRLEVSKDAFCHPYMFSSNLTVF